MTLPLPPPQKPRYIVCGGRDYRNRGHVFRILDALLQQHPGGVRIVQGGAPGADAEAREWAYARGQECETHPAKWKEHGRSAGPRRNEHMASLGAVACIAFPGGAGTINMFKAAEARGIRAFWA